MQLGPRSSMRGASGSRTRAIPGRAKRAYLPSSAIAQPKAITPRPRGPLRSLPPVMLDEALAALAARLRALCGTRPRGSLALLGAAGDELPYSGQRLHALVHAV